MTSGHKVSVHLKKMDLDVFIYLLEIESCRFGKRPLTFHINTQSLRDCFHPNGTLIFLHFKEKKKEQTLWNILVEAPDKA